MVGKRKEERRRREEMKTKSSFIDTPGRGVRSESMSLDRIGKIKHHRHGDAVDTW